MPEPDVDAAPEQHAPAAQEVRRPAARRVALLLRRPTFVLSAVVLAVWVFGALTWPLFGLDPFGRAGANLAPPSLAHLFGTDYLGRDVFARVVAGAGSALLVGPIGAVLATVLGSAVGLLCGYYRGPVDAAFMRLFDVLVVLPPLIVIVVLVGAFGVGTPALILIVALVFAPGIARIIRAATLAELGKSYVISARLQGESGPAIIVREILPNVFPTVLIQATLSLAAAIFMTASLSFLGLGSQPPSPDWGLSISDNRIYIQSAWWTVVFPALAVASVITATHLLADNIKEVSA
ncbi:peptide ABC transporter permease [Microbacterium mangrovi]|uniref:Peptide ABC transporter permease n=1 Tax=Microbacterium mangrovi TaxID=1348253 RepID=A0A0B2A4N4_9MICO|nr:peptide ABC transporter permease [Microbacterium mangrovi]